jgi:hypothetical protein
MPPVPPPSHHYHAALLRVALLLGAIAALVVLVLLYATGFFAAGGAAGSVTFFAHDAAATFSVRGDTATLSHAVETAGPLTAGDGTTFSAKLAMGEVHRIPVPGGGPPVVIAPPGEEWQLLSGSGDSSAVVGTGRPLGLMQDGTALVLTDKGLTAYVQGAKVVAIPGAGADGVGAVSADGSLAALRNADTHATDLYSIAPKSFKATFVASIPGQTTAVAFSDAGTLYILTEDGAVTSYTVSADAAPVLAGMAHLVNPWP